MRPALAMVVIAFATLAAAPALAQSAGSLRRLDWPGKPAAAETGSGPAAGAATARRTRPATPVGPNRYSARSGPAPAVWNPFPDDPGPVAPTRAAPVRPAPAPPATVAYAAPREPAPVRAAAPPPTVAAPAQPVRRPPAAAAPVRPTPPAAAAPAAPGGGEPAPRSYEDFRRPMTPPAAPQAAPAAPPSAEPAPRAYEEFRRPMTTPAPAGPPAAPQAAAPAPPSAAPAAVRGRTATGGDRPRYYSVHREYGRQPDIPELPEAFFIDAVGGEDLAAPPPPVPSERDERRARAAAADPDAP